MAAAATSRTLEVTIISGEDLRLERRQPVKKNAFVTVRTDNSSKSWSTKMDTEGGSYPFWNEKVVVDMPAHARFLTVEVHCKTYSGERVIGGARVPASDFTGGYFPENYLHFLSYRLRDGRGDGNGIINLSVRVKVSESGISNATATCAVAASCSRPWTGVPAGIPVAEKGSGGVVTGVPVRYGY